MKIAETKIYLRFLGWFLVVSLLPAVTLILVIYSYYPDKSIWDFSAAGRAILLGVLISVAFVFLLALIATRKLSSYITRPIQSSVHELSDVTQSLLKSVENLSATSKKNSEISRFLLTSSKDQKLGLDKGTKAVSGMVASLDQISIETRDLVNDAKDIDRLAIDGKKQSNQALESLATIKNLVTENQKLSHALDTYTDRVEQISKRMEVLAETAKFLSLNVSIEANKESFGAEFASLVSQIRELNITTEQAATGVNNLAKEMHQQIKQAKESSIFEVQETEKSIGIITQTVKFLGKISNRISSVSLSVKAIDKRTSANYQEADNISSMIQELSEQSKSLLRQTDDIAQVIGQQSAVSKELNQSSKSLSNVTDSLKKLVDKV